MYVLDLLMIYNTITLTHNTFYSVLIRTYKIIIVIKRDIVSNRLESDCKWNC